MASPVRVPAERAGALPPVACQTGQLVGDSPVSCAGAGGPGALIKPGTLLVSVELMSDVTVVSIAGEIDLATQDQFAGVLRMHLADGASTVVIDLAEIAFISSSAGRVLLTAVGEARRRGVRVRLVLGRAPRRVLDLLHTMDERVTVPRQFVP